MSRSVFYRLCPVDSHTCVARECCRDVTSDFCLEMQPKGQAIAAADVTAPTPKVNPVVGGWDDWCC